jgi:hypothetical protein
MGYKIPSCTEASQKLLKIQREAKTISGINVLDDLRAGLEAQNNILNLTSKEFRISDDFDREILQRIFLSKKAKDHSAIASSFHDTDYALLRRHIIDKAGNIIRESGKDERIGRYSEGFRVIKTSHGAYNSYNYLRPDGSKLFAEDVLNALDFSDGRGCFRQADGWHYVDSDGVVQEFFLGLPIIEAFPYYQGKACIRLDSNKSYQLLDKNGNYREIELPESGAIISSSEGVLQCRTWDPFEDAPWNYFIDTQGILLKKAYYETMPFSDGKAWVRTIASDVWTCMSRDGKILFAGDFEDVEDFHDGFALVSTKDKQYFVDENGNNVFGLELDLSEVDYASSFDEGLANIDYENRRITIDKKGRILAEIDYEV